MDATPHRDFAVEQKHVAATTPSAPQPVRQPVSATAECGSGWYHDVAIKESQQAPVRKH